MAEIDNSLGQNSSGLPDLALVAYTGEYSDLLNSPTLLSQFTNDVGFLTSIPNLEQVTTVNNVTDKGIVFSSISRTIEIDTINGPGSIIFYDSDASILAGMTGDAFLLANSIVPGTSLIEASSGSINFFNGNFNFQNNQFNINPDIGIQFFGSGSGNAVRLLKTNTTTGVTDAKLRATANEEEIIAYLSDIVGGSQSLQDVTTVGNITTNDILVSADGGIKGVGLSPIFGISLNTIGEGKTANIKADLLTEDVEHQLDNVSGVIFVNGLKRDGSNANSNIGLGAYSLSASELAGGVVQALGSNDNLQLKNGSVESGEVGLYSANADQKIATYVHVDSLYKYGNGKLVIDEVNDTLKFNSNEVAIKNYVDTELSNKENSITSGTTSQYWRGDKSWQILNKSAVGLANVDNTSDTSKPVSTAQQTALDLKLNKSKYISQGYTQLTGVTTTTVVVSLKIPAGTYASGDSFDIILTPSKSVTAAAIAVNVYHATSVNGTTNAICTAISLSTTQRTGYLLRNLTIDGTTLRNSMPVGASGIMPIAGTTAGTNTTFNPAVDNWITVTMNPTVVSEVVGFNNLTIRPL